MDPASVSLLSLVLEGLIILGTDVILSKLESSNCHESYRTKACQERVSHRRISRRESDQSNYDICYNNQMVSRAMKSQNAT